MGKLSEAGLAGFIGFMRIGKSRESEFPPTKRRGVIRRWLLLMHKLKVCGTKRFTDKGYGEPAGRVPNSKGRYSEVAAQSGACLLQI